MSDFGFVRAHLEEYVHDDPLGLQRNIAMAMLGAQEIMPYAFTEQLVLALISSDKVLAEAAKQGIAQLFNPNYDINIARLEAVKASLEYNLARHLLAILEGNYDRFTAYKGYLLVNKIVAADQTIRSQAKALIEELEANGDLDGTKVFDISVLADALYYTNR